MDVRHIIFGGMKSEPIASVSSMFLSILLYIMYSIAPYSTTNIPTKSLMPSYDFIVVGGGSAGMFFRDIDTKFRHKSDKNVTKTSAPVCLRARNSALLLIRSTDTKI